MGAFDQTAAAPILKTKYPTKKILAMSYVKDAFFGMVPKYNEFGGDQKNLDAGYDAMKRAMPIKISDFTGNMQTLLERGECRIAGRAADCR